jgi:3-phosphoglycerate kinase
VRTLFVQEVVQVEVVEVVEKLLPGYLLVLENIKYQIAQLLHA